MKIIFILVILFALLGAVVYFSGSEKSHAAIEAIRNNAEDQLVQVAGEGQTAMVLMKKQYAALKERLIHIKTLKRSTERRITEAKNEALQHKSDGEDEKAMRKEGLARRYETNLEKLKKHELEAEDALKAFAVEYKLFKDELAILQEELEATRSMGGLSNPDSIDSELQKRMETVYELKEKLTRNLDRAEAAMEVNELEQEF